MLPYHWAYYTDSYQCLNPFCVFNVFSGIGLVRNANSKMPTYENLLKLTLFWRKVREKVGHQILYHADVDDNVCIFADAGYSCLVWKNLAKVTGGASQGILLFLELPHRWLVMRRSILFG